MTLQDIRDDFVFKYKLECAKRGSKEIQFPDRALAKFISEAQQDIQRRHNILSGEYTLVMIEDVYTYQLPTDCGNVIKVMVDNVPLERKNINEIRDLLPATGVPTCYATVLNDCLSIQFDLTTADEELTVYYEIDPHYFSSEDTDWGTFIGKFAGRAKLPQRYNNAIVLYMLSQIYDDLYPKYEKEMASLRESQYHNRTSLKYNMGGY